MLPLVLQELRKRPGMYVSPANGTTAVAFVDGYNAAVGGGLLVGFREWLVIRLGWGGNLHWGELVGELMKDEDKQDRASDEDEVVSLNFVLDTLDQFLRERAEAQGLRRIFLEYEAWLQRQDWYGPSSPEWLSVDKT